MTQDQHHGQNRDDAPTYHEYGRAGDHWRAADAAWDELQYQRRRYDIDDEEAHQCQLDQRHETYAELVDHARAIDAGTAPAAPTPSPERQALAGALGRHWPTLAQASAADRRQLIRLLGPQLAPAIARLNTTPTGLAERITAELANEPAAGPATGVSD